MRSVLIGVVLVGMTAEKSVRQHADFSLVADFEGSIARRKDALQGDALL
jgi:hypothetical protein